MIECPLCGYPHDDDNDYLVAKAKESYDKSIKEETAKCCIEIINDEDKYVNCITSAKAEIRKEFLEDKEDE